MDMKILLAVLVALSGAAWVASDLSQKAESTPRVQVASGSADDRFIRIEASAPQGPGLMDRFYEATGALMGGNTMQSMGKDRSEARSEAIAQMRGMVAAPDGTRQAP